MDVIPQYYVRESEVESFVSITENRVVIVVSL